MSKSNEATIMKPETMAACEAAKQAIETAKALLQAEVQDSLSRDDPADLVRTYADLSEEGDAFRASIADISKAEQNLSYTQIPAMFDAHGIQNVKVTGYGLVSLIRKWSCSMLDKERGFAFLRAAGQGGMIIETVAAPTLGAWAGAQVRETGIEPPDEIFKTTVVRHVSLRRSR
jgi:hypothetical protein